MLQVSDPDYSLEIVADLYRYRPRQQWLATLLAVSLGIFGAHRFYCGKSFTGLLMLLSAGGGLLWWLWDLFHIREMVGVYNAEEHRRQEQQLPPQALSFLPPKDQLDLHQAPAWVIRRSGRGRILSSALLLWIIGFSLGAVGRAAQVYEPVYVLVLFVCISLVAARWAGLRQIPVLNALVRWVHRLRLYYHTVDPGSVWALATRPILGVFFAPWRPKARAEVRLYLQLGVAMACVFAAGDLADLLRTGGLWSGIGFLLAEFLQTLLFTYLFVAPAGALLTTQLLIARRDYVVWVLSGLTLLAIYYGLGIIGAE